MWSTIAALIGFGALALFLMRRTISRRDSCAISDREDLDPDAIYSRFCEANGWPRSLALELWSEIAHSLDIPPGKLRPNDRFDGELGPVEEWDDNIVDLHMAAERRMSRLNICCKTLKIRTVKEYITFFTSVAPK